MSQGNIERLRAAYEAFNQTGEIVIAHLAPDFEMRQASSIIDTAVTRAASSVLDTPGAARTRIELIINMKTAIKPTPLRIPFPLTSRRRLRAGVPGTMRATVFHGPNAIRDVLCELEEAFEDLRSEAEKFFEAPTGEIVVFVRVLGRGRGSGAEMDNRIAHVWTYRDDKAIRMVAYEEQADALAAVGLQE